MSFIDIRVIVHEKAVQRKRRRSAASSYQVDNRAMARSAVDTHATHEDSPAEVDEHLTQFGKG